MTTESKAKPKVVEAGRKVEFLRYASLRMTIEVPGIPAYFGPRLWNAPILCLRVEITCRLPSYPAKGDRGGTRGAISTENKGFTGGTLWHSNCNRDRQMRGFSRAAWHSYRGLEPLNPGTLSSVAPEIPRAIARQVERKLRGCGAGRVPPEDFGI